MSKTIGHAYRKMETLASLKVLLLQHPRGMKWADILSHFNGLDPSTVHRALVEIGADGERGVWRYAPTAADREFATAVMGWKQE